MSTRVRITQAARAAYQPLPDCPVPVGSIWQAGDGTLLRVEPDGQVEPVSPTCLPWRRSVAETPGAIRGT